MRQDVPGSSPVVGGPAQAQASRVVVDLHQPAGHDGRLGRFVPVRREENLAQAGGHHRLEGVVGTGATVNVVATRVIDILEPQLQPFGAFVHRKGGGQLGAVRSHDPGFHCTRGLSAQVNGNAPGAGVAPTTAGEQVGIVFNPQPAAGEQGRMAQHLVAIGTEAEDGFVIQFQGLA